MYFHTMALFSPAPLQLWSADVRDTNYRDTLLINLLLFYPLVSLPLRASKLLAPNTFVEQIFYQFQSNIVYL